MRWCKPIYIGEKAREHQKDYRHLLESLKTAENRELMFYVLAAPANEQNLLELLPAYYLKQAVYREESLVILGLAANKKEAFELCARILGDCYICHGRISRELLFEDAVEKE